ncbi:hypothetical protein Tco_1389093 [Tanacetum coccineum]
MRDLTLVLQCMKGEGDALKQYEADIKAMNLILISIPNDIYNSVDACQSAKQMWDRVKRLMRGAVLNQFDKETWFNNEFEQLNHKNHSCQFIIASHSFRMIWNETKLFHKDMKLKLEDKLFLEIIVLINAHLRLNMCGH